MTGPGNRRPEGWVRRPHGWVRHYAGLMGPAGRSAARALMGDKRPERIAGVRTALVRRRDPHHPTQRALVAAPGGQLRWRAVPAPSRSGPLGAVVHPIAVATCDMDRPIMLATTPFPLPLQLGHECVAEIVEVGAEVRTVRAGQRVVVPFQINCGTCAPCRGGNTGNCTGVPALSMYGFGVAGGPWGGAITDLVAVPFADAMLVPLPDQLDAVAAASVADNVSDAYRHVGPYLPTLLAQDLSTRVLILGGLEKRPELTTSMSLYTGLIARALGARHVDVVDSRPDVRALAERLGLRPVAPGDVGQVEPAPLVVDATGTGAGLVAALRHTAPDGRCSSVGGLHARVKLPYLEAYLRNVTIHIGHSHARAIIPEVLALMVDGRLRPELVTTQVAAIEDAVPALDQHCRDGAIKTILTAS
ncbi:MAG: zinc-dependent alcohol dehydrogenase [Acidimicrobiales bacterium]